MKVLKAGLWAVLLIAGMAAQWGEAQGGIRIEPAPLWQIGAADDKSDEFVDYRAAAPQIEIAPGRSAPAVAAAAGKGLHGVEHAQLEIVYHLESLPPHGVQFSFKLLDATRNGPQMAVFSNGLMAGLIQLLGTAETGSTYPWKKTYRLYIPRELLAVGRNVLTLKSCRPMWSDASVEGRLWWRWDYLRLEALAAPAREPIHGAVAYLGTTLKLSANDFFVNDDTLQLAPLALEWLGIAWCGNTIRADFWCDVGHLQPRRLEYLKLLRDWNMTVVADHVSSGHFQNRPDGSMPQEKREAIKQFFTAYGNYVQFYEIANEPCMFGGGLAETLNVARWVNQVKPPHVKTVAPGWAYGGGRGTPANWDADAANRRRVEALCQATNGHSYGFSYADNRGGSFVENLRAFGGVDDGWPKPFLNTETGTNNWHSEENGTRFASTQPHAQAFDRILRAHLAVVQRTMQHAAIFDDFGLFQGPFDAKNPTALRAFPGVKGEDSRLKTYRRLALAYSTHGAPLPYVFLDADALRGRMVCFRAVDTAALPALPGSGGASNRVLLNCVNFENRPQKVEVRVTMPQRGMYRGPRYGAGETYAQARQDVTLHATPTLDLAIELGPGDAVQYQLEPEKPHVPYPPTGLSATPGDRQATLHWAGSAGAAQYTIRRARQAAGPFVILGTVQAGSTYDDQGLQNGQTYYYTVSAGNDEGYSGESAVAATTVGTALPPEGLRAAAGNRQVTLTFAASPGATAYEVHRTPGDHARRVPASSLAEIAYVDRDVDNGTTYFYAVSALGATSAGAPSESVSATPHAPPLSPSDLRCTAGDRRVVLSWTAVPGAGDYRVKRAVNSAGPFTVLADSLVQPTFTDDGVTNGATYFYVVSALSDASESADSAAVTAALEARPLPEGWKATDIGTVGRPGQASHNPGAKTFTVAGSGNDVWGPADGLNFVYRPWSGDGSLVVHVATFEETHEWARFGAMIRQGLEPGSPMAMMALTPGRGCNFLFRRESGGPCDMVGGPQERWLKITRAGSTIAGYVSQDGRQWKLRGKAEIPMSGPIYLGLGVCSHDQGRLNRVLFDRCQYEGPKP